MIPEGTQSELLGPLWGALRHQWVHFDVPVPPEAHSKRFQKIIEISVILGPPLGEGATTADGAPRQQKTHVFGKNSDFAAEGCKFSVSGFRYPLREVNFIDFL